MTLRHFPRRLTRMLLLLGLLQAVPGLVLPSTARAQISPNEARARSREDEAKKEALKEPVDWQVYQRNDRDQADIPIVLGERFAGRTVVAASLSPAPPRRSVAAGVYRDGKLVNVPAGGPYHIRVVVEFETGNPTLRTLTETLTAGPVFVGDLWVLAGQSNMEGVGDLIDVTLPSPRVSALGMDGRWVQAEEPLHWLVDSPDPVHSGNPDDRGAQSKDQHKNRTKGAGLGLPFATAMVAATQVPVGLVI